MIKKRGILTVVSGFAGTGKGTLMKELIKNYDNYALSISMTTRNKRPQETDGIEYFFSDQKTFKQKIEEDGFIEYACYCGNYYGTPRDYVELMLEKGMDVILEIEIQGALQVKEKIPETLLLFVMPPSAKILLDRLVGRGTETLEVVNERMLRAVEESDGIEKYDYILVNDEISVCMEEMHNIIQSEKNRASRNLEFIEVIRQELSGLTKGDL